MENIQLNLDQRLEYVRLLSGKGDAFLKAGLELLRKLDEGIDISEALTSQKTAILLKRKNLKKISSRKINTLGFSAGDCFSICGQVAPNPLAYAACVLVCLASP